MTETAPSTAAAPLSLWSRVIGVITSPKATFENVVAAPRPFGILFLAAVVIGLAAAWPQFTETGRQAAIDMNVRMFERMGQQVTPDMYQRFEQQADMGKYFAPIGALVTLPIFSLFFAALYWVVFNTAMGGTGAFKQVLAIVTHSQVITALGAILGAPIMVMQGKLSMSGPFNLGALVPMLEPDSMLASFLGGLNVFSFWGLIVTGIGLGVLYRRSGRNISIALIVVFLLIMLAVTAGFSSLFGGAAGR